MSCVLVTGATGFVGSALVTRLLEERRQVRVLARDADQAAVWRDTEVDVRIASLGDPNAIAAAADGVEVLYHCAAENSAAASPAALAWINVAGSENVRNAARHAGVRRLVHLSCTDVTLSNRDRMSWKESRQLDGRPLDGVCRTKLLSEELMLQSSDRALEVCALRPAWLWGPGERRLLPGLCREAARGRVSLCGAGENLLPTSHLDNLVDALLLAADAQHVGGRAYHIIDGEAWTAREFLGALCQALGSAPPRRSVYALAYSAAWLRERLGGTGLTRADVARRGRSALFDAVAAAHDLGYEPRVGIEEGMRNLTAWVEQCGGLNAIARSARPPATQREVDALVRLSESDGASAS